MMKPISVLQLMHSPGSMTDVNVRFDESLASRLEGVCEARVLVLK